jgi:hypothetical protein
MHAEAKGDSPDAPTGRVLAWMPRHRDLADGLRTYLEVAGVTRADLHTEDATRKAMTFHDLRATGLTWLAIRGDDPLKIKQRAGHSAFTTTEGYIRERPSATASAESSLPTSLLATPTSTELGPLRSTIGPRKRDLERLKRGVSRRYVAGWTGLERDQVGTIAAPSTEHRAVASDDTPAMVADAALNETHLDRDLDQRQPVHQAADEVEAALAKGLEGATAAGRFDVVALLAGELQARRLAREGVATFATKARQRGA